MMFFFLINFQEVTVDGIMMKKNDQICEWGVDRAIKQCTQIRRPLTLAIVLFTIVYNLRIIMIVVRYCCLGDLVDCNIALWWWWWWLHGNEYFDIDSFRIMCCWWQIPTRQTCEFFFNVIKFWIMNLTWRKLDQQQELDR